MSGYVVSALNNLLQKREAMRSSLRALARKNRDELELKERIQASLAIGERVCALPELSQAKSIFLYCAFRSEVETENLSRTLQEMGKIICFPQAVPATRDLLPIQWDWRKPDSCLKPGYRGIPEPQQPGCVVFPPEELDMVIMPGLLFDRNGNRLGYGGGYYDRFLANKAPQALRVGLGFSSQLTISIPAQAHDMRLDILVTDAEILRWPKK